VKALFNLGHRKIGLDFKPYFIADIAANHDGDLQRAKTLIMLAAESGADAAKFQHFRAETIVSAKGFDSIGGRIAHQKSWKKSVVEVYRDAEVPWEWTSVLADEAKKCGIDFFTAPYDLEAVNFVDQYVVAYKVGSGDIDWIEEVELMASKGKPMLVATGASSIQDVERVVSSISAMNAQLVLMQCNTNYTGEEANLEHLNLNVLSDYKKRFPEVILGLSDHTAGSVSVLGAIALGARVIEKHFTDDKSRRGPDHGFSLNPTEWTNMVRDSNHLFQALGDGMKKVEQNELESSIVQRRAMRYRRDLAAGHVLQRSDVIPLRPAEKGGFRPFEIDLILGKTIRESVSQDELVIPDNFSIS
jgi:N-acetylneuraminate synthase